MVGLRTFAGTAGYMGLPDGYDQETLGWSPGSQVLFGSWTGLWSKDWKIAYGLFHSYGIYILSEVFLCIILFAHHQYSNRLVWYFYSHYISIKNLEFQKRESSKTGSLLHIRTRVSWIPVQFSSYWEALEKRGKVLRCFMFLSWSGVEVPELGLISRCLPCVQGHFIKPDTP